MGMKLTNAHGLNSFLICGHYLSIASASNGYYLHVFAIVMALAKTRINGPINFQFMTWFIIENHFMLFSLDGFQVNGHDHGF